MRKIIQNLSNINKNIANMRTQVSLMGNAQSLASDQVIQDNLQGITCLKGLLVEFNKELIFTTHGQMLPSLHIKQLCRALEIHHL